MKNIKKQLAQIGMWSAKSAVNSASPHFYHQTKEPSAARAKLLKK